MSMAEPLCDLRFVKAEYRLAQPTDEAPENLFDISIRPLAGAKHAFSMAEKNGEQFAAELDVLAALIRAWIIRARVEGEEAE
jgi:predicted nuclease of restriction endonuclease-like RecB superfamily